VIDLSPLDNPIWHALNSLQRSFNCGTAVAARYPAEVSRFAALAHPTREAFSGLASLVQPGDTVALFTADALSVPAEWTVLRSRSLDQMVCHRMDGGDACLDLQLGAKDVPEMLALAHATDPGPFSEGTIRMGRYYCQISLIRSADSVTRSATSVDSLIRSAAEVFSGGRHAVY
jgi:hypothetical protein